MENKSNSATAPAETWERVQELFFASVDLPHDLQVRFLDTACRDRAEIRKEVESLLASDGKNGSSIAAAVEEEAQALLGVNDVAGSRLGAWKVIREIGRGGMGAVYLAGRDDDQFQKQVAIKLVKRGMDTADVLGRFRDERQILANLDHPYIARLIDGGTAPDGRPFFVMEYVEGQPIDSYCNERHLDVRERCRLFLKVCEAVSHAHRNLVVHRDLKPGNIFVSAEGSPKLLDFGVAKMLAPTSDPGMTATAVNLRPLTPQYASPEQILGQPVNTTTDVYSLGAVLYELLTGSKAHRFQSSTHAELERVICATEVSRPSTAIQAAPEWPVAWRRQLKGDLDTIVLKAMRKEPDRRYSSVEQFAEDIRRFLDGRPVLARKDSVSYRTGKFVRRHRYSIAAAGLVFTSLLFGIVIALSEARTAQQRLTQMVELANRSLFDVHTAIERLPGAMDARRQIVATTLQYLENLSKDAGRDQRLRLALSAAYFRLGDVQGYQFTPNLGDAEGALKSYRQAAALILPLRAKHPNDPDLLQRWVEIQNRIGIMMLGKGDLAGSGAAFRSALPDAVLLARLKPSDPEAVRQEALLTEGIANGLQFTDSDQAISYARRNLAISSGLVKNHPDNFELINQLSDADALVGAILDRQGDLMGALEEFRQCAALREQEVKAHPTDVIYRRNLVIAYGHIAATLGSPLLPNLGDTKGAREYYGKAVALAREIAQADPADRTGQFDLASSLLRYAALDVPREEMAESLAMLREAAGMLESLSRADPQALRYKRALGIVYEFIGHRLRDLGRPGEAVAEYQRSVAMVGPIFAGHPNDTSSLSQSVVDNDAIAKVLAAEGDRAGALQSGRKAVQLAEGFLEHATDREIGKAVVARAYFELGSVYQILAKQGGQADWREGKSAAEHALSDLRALIANRRTPALDKELALSESLLADCDAHLGTKNKFSGPVQNSRRESALLNEHH